MSCPFGSHSSQLGGSDLSVQAVTSTPTEALPYILSPGQSCFFFFLHFAYFSKVADISSHIKDLTSRFLKCNLNSSSPSYLSKLFSITDFKRDCVTPLCFFFFLIGEYYHNHYLPLAPVRKPGMQGSLSVDQAVQIQCPCFLEDD